MSDAIIELKYPDGYGQPDDLVGMTRLVAGNQYMGEKYLPLDGRTVKKSAYPDLMLSSSSFSLVPWATLNTTQTTAINYTGKYSNWSMRIDGVVRDPLNANRILAILSQVTLDSSDNNIYWFSIRASLDEGKTWSAVYESSTSGNAYQEMQFFFINNKYILIGKYGHYLTSTNLTQWTAAGNIFTNSNSAPVWPGLYTYVNRFTVFKNKIYGGVYSKQGVYSVRDMITGVCNTEISLMAELGNPSSENLSGGVLSGYFFTNGTLLYFYDPVSRQVLRSTDGITFVKIATLTQTINSATQYLPSFTIIDNNIIFCNMTEIFVANLDFTVVRSAYKLPNGMMSDLSTITCTKHPLTGYIIIHNIGYVYNNKYILGIFNADLSEFINITNSGQSSSYRSANLYNLWINDGGLQKFMFPMENATIYISVPITDTLFGDMTLPNVPGPNANLKYYIRAKI